MRSSVQFSNWNLVADFLSTFLCFLWLLSNQKEYHLLPDYIHSCDSHRKRRAARRGKAWFVALFFYVVATNGIVTNYTHNISKYLFMNTWNVFNVVVALCSVESILEKHSWESQKLFKISKVAGSRMNGKYRNIVSMSPGLSIEENSKIVGKQVFTIILHNYFERLQYRASLFRHILSLLKCRRITVFL